MIMNAKQASEICAGKEISSELQLILRAQRGDDRAFFALYELYKRRVYSLCLRISGVAEEAEDLTREVFLQVFRGIPAFKEEGEFAAAIKEQLIKVAISARRARKSGPRHSRLTGDGIERGRQSAAGKALTRCADPPQGRLLPRDFGNDTGPRFWN